LPKRPAALLFELIGLGTNGGPGARGNRHQRFNNAGRIIFGYEMFEALRQQRDLRSIATSMNRFMNRPRRQVYEIVYKT